MELTWKYNMNLTCLLGLCPENLIMFKIFCQADTIQQPVLNQILVMMSFQFVSVVPVAYDPINYKPKTFFFKTKVLDFFPKLSLIILKILQQKCNVGAAQWCSG